jgi:PHD/YefM family antitoxin component YafN of YafNO toxin-antitoxin module
MTDLPPLPEPARVDEPQAVQEYADVLSRVAGDGQPVIVRRNGNDLVAVINLEYLAILQDALLQEARAREECEHLAAQIDWERVEKTHRPPQWWFDDDDNPFEPEEGLSP